MYTEEAGDPRWLALRRTGVLTAVLNKHIQFIALADRRAQVVLAIYAFLIPLSVATLSQHMLRVAMCVFLVFSLSSAGCALMSLLPKRYRAVNECECQLMHFSGISRFTESEYMERMQTLMQKPEGLTSALVRDIYHISHDLIRPKFLWMRASYLLLFAGSGLTIAAVLVQQL